ncbi:hypothetical protein Tsubulata_008115 [Turnera subulata]|uniref:Glycosyltransferase n=1 Tax=Turnera subulata TaxID=218843 RepID=A0A9Q0JHW9_9ROSI|nr:hypothetical protein Tsubulata_008115 [Turnera subulata]
MDNPGDDDSKQQQQLHVVMYPWIAYGHWIPYLHLSNKLAERGVRVSFLLPKSAQVRLDKDNRYPHLIRFFPVAIPHVDGLPPGVETNSDVASHLVGHLFSAFDKTKHQVQTYLTDLNPDLVFYDLAHWLPALGGFKSVRYSIVQPVTQAFFLTPSRELHKEKNSVEAFMQPPPGFPSPSIRLKRHEAQRFAPFLFSKFGDLSFYDRLTTSLREADAIAVRSYREIHGPIIDYLAQEYTKPLLLTGPLLPKASPAADHQSPEDEKWVSWLNKFEADSVVYCGFGSQTTIDKDQFQELVLGFELTGLPFLVALKPPHGCATVEEALPEGFEERVQGRGMVNGGWVPQLQILQHPSTGCFVSHCGGGSVWESLANDCQIVLIPLEFEQTMGARFLIEELQVAVEVERGESMWVSKESLSKAIKQVMDGGSTVAGGLKRNHAKIRALLSSKDTEHTYMDNFIRGLGVLLESN